jgi:hypothetical protein
MLPELKMTSTAHEFARLGMGVQRFGVFGSAMRKPQGRWANHDKLDAMTDFVLRYQAEQERKARSRDDVSNRLISNIESAKPNGRRLRKKPHGRADSASA